MKERAVGDLVRGRPVYVVRTDDSVLDAVRYMSEHRVGAVPVLAEGDMVGIISERDVMTRVVAQELDPASTKVSEVMMRKVAVLGEDNTCRDALTIMKRLHVRHLPVMAGKRIAGCVSLRELQVVGINDKEVKIKFLDDL